MKIDNMSDAELLTYIKNNLIALKELNKRFPNSLLVELEKNKLLSFIGEKKVKEWLKEIKNH